MSKYYYLGDQMQLDDRYRATISMFDGASKLSATVSGNIQSDFSVSGGNNYDEQGAHLESVIGQTDIGAAAIAGLNLLRTAGSAASGANRFLTQVGSQLTWQGSKSPSLNLEMTFVCLDSENPKESVVRRVNKLMSAVYPDLNSESHGLVFSPPLGYRTEVIGGSNKNANLGTSVLTNAGKCSLKIGKWFHAKYLVIEDVQFTYSKEVNKKGEPLYAIGSITLRPYRTITFKEFKSWHIGQ